MQQWPWMTAAWAELGVAERRGPAGNTRIERFYAESGHPEVRGDEVAWCAAFVGACLHRAGITGTRSLRARSYVDWGDALDTPAIGAIAVLSRGEDPALGHVAFVAGFTAEHLILLGGNQGDEVSVAAFDRGRLLALRMPPPATEPAFDAASASAAQSSATARFDAALAHVLAMEGGWSEDPHDPGGPTQRGITLSVFAADRGQAITPQTYGRLKDELRAIAMPDIRRIYHDRYWSPSRAASLPGGIALMHFDAAVNHGVGRAARLLQHACGVEVDGEIGPLTRAAAEAADPVRLLGRYAELRRQHYRSLGHYWRFGRGWMNRVERTLAAARRLASDTTPHPPKEIRDMTDSQNTTRNEANAKWWGQSLTIWGAIITAVSAVLPVLGPFIGLEITPELVRLLGEQLAMAAKAIGGVVGTVMTIYGRARATTRIERRDVVLHV